MPIYSGLAGHHHEGNEVSVRDSSHKGSQADPVNVIVKAGKTTNGKDETAEPHYTFSSFAPAHVSKANRNEAKITETVKSNNTIVI